MIRRSVEPPKAGLRGAVSREGPAHLRHFGQERRLLGADTCGAAQGAEVETPVASLRSEKGGEYPRRVARSASPASS